MKGAVGEIGRPFFTMTTGLSTPTENPAEQTLPGFIHGQDRAVGQVTLMTVAMGARQDRCVGAAAVKSKCGHGSIPCGDGAVCMVDFSEFPCQLVPGVADALLGDFLNPVIIANSEELSCDIVHGRHPVWFPVADPFRLR